MCLICLKKNMLEVLIYVCEMSRYQKLILKSLASFIKKSVCLGVCEHLHKNILREKTNLAKD